MTEFALESGAFDHAQAIPNRYTCDGEDLSPPLRWANVPDEARSLARCLSTTRMAVLYSNTSIPTGSAGSGGQPAGNVFAGFVSDATDISSVLIDDYDSNATFPDSNIGTDSLRFGQMAGPPPEQSTGNCDGSGTHANNGSACQRDPVNSLTGAFTTSVTDLRLPGIGVPFSWTRSYTSSDSTAGRLGPGWTDSYATSLLIQPNGDVLLHGDEGQQVYYTKQPSGAFVGASGALSTLSSVAGGYKLVRQDQVTYLFDTQGRLTSMKD